MFQCFSSYYLFSCPTKSGLFGSACWITGQLCGLSLYLRKKMESDHAHLDFLLNLIFKCDIFNYRNIQSIMIIYGKVVYSPLSQKHSYQTLRAQSRFPPPPHSLQWGVFPPFFFSALLWVSTKKTLNTFKNRMILGCAATKCWSKYTTVKYQVKTFFAFEKI